MHSFFSSIWQIITILPAFVMIGFGLYYTYRCFGFQVLKGIGLFGSETTLISSKFGSRAIILIFVGVLWLRILG